MSNINCGIWVLQLNVKYWRIFVTSFLCSLKFLLFQLIGHTKRRLQKHIKHFLLWYDCTFKKQCTVPVTLTFDLSKSIFVGGIDSDPISVLYEFQIDISANSWEIKYQNMGIGLYRPCDLDLWPMKVNLF